MAPNALSETANEKVSENQGIAIAKSQFNTEIVWSNIRILALFHLMAFYGLYAWITGRTMIYTVLFHFFMSEVGTISVTSGCHRLWAHRTYKAKWPLRLFLATANMFAGQNSIFEWCRDHRTHHKFTDTDADPHNYKRGFFFAHMGWLLCRKHPDVKVKGKTVDMSDVLADPIVRFQMKIYTKSVLYIFIFVIPTLIPVYFWNESIIVALASSFTRYILSLHLTWLVNSAAHSIGYKSYDSSITSTESSFLICLIGAGEFFHNFHHAFPWDYRASEYGWLFNRTTAFIDLMGWLGLAYDCRTASDESIKKLKQTTGDGLRPWHVIGYSN